MSLALGHEISGDHPGCARGNRTAEPPPISCSIETWDASLRSDASILALIRFEPGGSEVDDPRAVHVPLPLLDGVPKVEVWRSGAPVCTGRAGPIGYAETGNLL